jgi:hypothetical protein
MIDREQFALAIIHAGVVPPPHTRPSGDDQGNIDTRKAWARDVWAMVDALLPKAPSTPLSCDCCGQPPFVDSDEGDRCTRQIQKADMVVLPCRGRLVRRDRR